MRLVSLQYDELQHLRRLDRVKSRILSIAWGPPVPRQTKTQGGGDDSDSDDDDDNDSGAVQDVPLWERMADDAMDSVRARL